MSNHTKCFIGCLLKENCKCKNDTEKENCDNAMIFFRANQKPYNQKQKQMNYLEKVSEFHETFKHPILKKPGIPNKKRVELRISLLQEELNELKSAIEKNDIVECADAFCDLQYVLSGAVLEFGFQKKFNTLFDEVHRSNMSKACESAYEANETCE